MAGPTIPGYEGLTQIGKGGFSRVYRGEQAKLKRGVAIKVLNFGLNDEADRRSFERECELMGRVSTHPNIVTVHDTAFTQDGQPCIVMEHYPGGSLADLISEVRRLNTKEVLEVGVSIASALEASHQAGVLHCDLKPQNILISEFGQPALGDFGISTFSEERTRTGGDAGAGFTLAYAAPEIVEGASPSIESDVYSLAATLYTSLAGRRPFYYPGPEGEKPTAAEQARRILLEEPSPLTDSGVPAELDQVIRNAMAKDTASRPSSAADFARSLYLVGQKLGLGTSSPRIADQGALPVLDPRADFTEPRPRTTTAASASPQPSADTDSRSWATEAASAPATADDATSARPALADLLDDATALRPVDEATALRLEPMAPAPAAPAHAPAETQISAQSQGSAQAPSSRRQLAPIIGVVSLLAVAAVLYFVTQSGGGEDVAVATPVPTVGAPQAEVLLAPPAPRDVQAVRVGSDSVVLSWSNPPAEDIRYEVRRDDGDDRTIAESPVILTDIDPDDITCFDVAAIRGNRLVPASDDACVRALGATYVQATPAQCEGACEVSLTLTGFVADELVAVTAVDAATGDPVQVDYDQELRTDADGAAPNWRLSFLDDSPVSTYLIELTPATSGETHRAVVVVTPAS